MLIKSANITKSHIIITYFYNYISMYLISFVILCFILETLF